MLKLATLFTTISLTFLSASAAYNSSYAATCNKIATSVSKFSTVYYPGSSQYTNDLHHWASSSSQNSACAFEPADAQDIGIALQILSNDQTPFAVISGGGSMMPGFSSTPGVQIALHSFSEILYDADSQTVTVGLGLVWDDVYSELDKYNVTALGAKFTGVGIGGVVLGGGYSYLTNQYGLVVDNVMAFELVLPNGTVTNVTNDMQPDLFYGLRGGFNNFGIVTKATLKTYPLGEVWGGLIVYPESEWDAVHTAVADFLGNVSDPKASIDFTVNNYEGVTLVIAMLFYSEPEYPDGIFDELLSIPFSIKDVQTRSYLDLIQSYPVDAVEGLRAYLHWIVFEQATASTLQMILNQTQFYAAEARKSSGVSVTYNIRPFLSSLYDHGDIPSAFPSTREGQGHSFVEAYFGWTDESSDKLMLQLGDESAAYMKQYFVDAGQDTENALLYPNCSPPDASMESMYGDALDRLHSIRAAADPDDVMSLTGGWRF